MKNDQILLTALERIADPLNTHFKGDAQVVAREALEKWKASAPHECDRSSNGKHMWCMFGDQAKPRCNWCGEVSEKDWKTLREGPLYLPHQTRFLQDLPKSTAVFPPQN